MEARCETTCLEAAVHTQQSQASVQHCGCNRPSSFGLHAQASASTECPPHLTDVHQKYMHSYFEILRMTAAVVHHQPQVASHTLTMVWRRRSSRFQTVITPAPPPAAIRGTLPPVLNAMHVQAPPPGLGLVAEARSWSPLPTPAALAKLAMTSLYFRFSNTACLHHRYELVISCLS